MKHYEHNVNICILLYFIFVVVCISNKNPPKKNIKLEERKKRKIYKFVDQFTVNQKMRKSKERWKENEKRGNKGRKKYVEKNVTKEK